MRKSNILLLGGFLAVVMLISAIHITLYAKYKSGNYTVYKEDDELASPSLQSFPNILMVSVRDVPGARVVFSDVARLEKEQQGIRYERKGDTLQISGMGSADNEGFQAYTTFYVPHSATLSAFNSSLSFRTDKKTTGNSPTFYLQRSRAFFSGPQSHLQFGNVKIVATDSSMLLFEGKTEISNLNLQLSNSTFEYGNGDIGQLSIETDSLSRLSLQTKLLSKADIRTIPVK